MRRHETSVVAMVFAMTQAVALFCACTVCAQMDLPLLGVECTHEYAELTGWVTIPPATGSLSVRLVIAGSQVSGRIVSGCPPSQHPAGAEVHLMLSLAGIFDWLYFSAYLPAVDGDLVVEIPCHSVSSVIAWGTGPNEFRMYIGYDPDFAPVCWGYSPFPELTIATARLVVDAPVATEHSSWGTVKSLFR